MIDFLYCLCVACHLKVNLSLVCWPSLNFQNVCKYLMMLYSSMLTQSGVDVVCTAVYTFMCMHRGINVYERDAH